MPNIFNLEIYQGDDYAAEITVTDSDDAAAADLTGYTTQAQIRRGPADEYPDIVVRFAVAMTLPNLVTLTIPHDLTAQLVGRYIWDMQLTDPSGYMQTLVAGDVVVTKEVTR